MGFDDSKVGAFKRVPKLPKPPRLPLARFSERTTLLLPFSRLCLSTTLNGKISTSHSRPTPATKKGETVKFLRLASKFLTDLSATMWLCFRLRSNARRYLATSLPYQREVWRDCIYEPEADPRYHKKRGNPNRISSMVAGGGLEPPTSGL